VEFSLTKKVFKDQLDPSDDKSYLQEVVNTSTFGFPVNQNGYYKIFDLDKSIFTVGRDVTGEAFLSINTQDHFYRSDSVVPNTRDENSFITIDKVIENEGDEKSTYPYFAEGTFKVNLFEDFYGSTSEMIEGKFRWPIADIKDSELLDVCN
jgi:hypothetical protein